MKKVFSIILYVLLGIIILPILYLIFVALLDTFYKAGDFPSSINVYISMALSIPLSIIIPIIKYKRAIKNKERLSLEVNNIESLKNELNQLSQDDPNRKTKEEELKKLENHFRKDQKNKDIKKEFFRNIALLIFVPLLTLGLLMWFFSGDDPAENKDLDSYLKKDTSSKTTINESGRKALVQRWNDPGYTEASFPQKDSFWIFIKSPPNPADVYATMACKIAKSEYNVKGFTITIWDFDKVKYGKARCY